ncbi:MAG: YoaP domain-containing protein [Candidatus Cloacimonetes bacterium]|nr:YoaP domain-containing protein [Candidatus Cloacimonadota bacterium]
MVKIIDTTPDSIHKYGMCGYKNLKNEGYKRKIDWIKQHYKKGMKYKILFSEDDGAIGGIEYLPGEFAWRSVETKGFMFIHCIYILSRKYKEQGYGINLLNECIKDAKMLNMNGVAVVTRKGSFMQGNEIFIKTGFEIVDKAEPDFELLVKKFNSEVLNPKFKEFSVNLLKKYSNGLYIITSSQCPYAIKSVTDITKIVEEKYKIKVNIIELQNYKEAQDTPCAFGIFCIIHNEKVIADHPISSRRFCNIMEKRLNL